MAESSNSNILAEIRDLKFGYTSNKEILKISDLTLLKGQNTFLLGPSGSGKSTLLGLLTGILTATSGDLRVLGNNLRQLKPHQRDAFRGEHVGYIFQMFNLIPYLTVLENIVLPITINVASKNKTDKEANEKAIELAQSLGIRALLEQTASKISVGQAQRVAAARALINEPELILADEPTSALDTNHRNRFIELLFRIAEGQKSTIVFVSHDESLQHLFERHLSLAEINEVAS